MRLPWPAALLLLALPAHAVGPTFVVDAGTVHTMVAGAQPLTSGRVVVVDGRITCLGRTEAVPGPGKVCAVPQGAKTFAFPQGVIVPGLVESLSRLGQVEVDAEDESHDGVPGKNSNLAHVRAIDGIAMNSRSLEAAHHAGVTAVLARPLGNALIAGQSLAFHTTGNTVDDALVAGPVAIHVNLGQEARADMPLVGARSGQLALLRTFLSQAKQLADAEKKPPKTPALKDAIQKLADDPGIAALADVVWKQRRPLVVHAHRADEIAAALRLQRELGFVLVIAGGAEAHMVAKELAAQQVSVLVGPVRVAPFGWNTRQARLDNAAILAQAGVRVGLATAETHNARNLRFEAGFAASAGKFAALEAITRLPAEILGLPTTGKNAVGTIGEGQWADFAVFSGDPTQYGSQVLLVSVAGQVTESPTQR